MVPVADREVAVAFADVLDLYNERLELTEGLARAQAPALTAPDGTPVHRHPRTDFDALRGSLRVESQRFRPRA
ncbi:hypothetical protein [Paraburkholderia sp. BR14320]|uniref:hypothetical protein n=1 Tax=unclassified Paraburkholderia TaxID=2615204 RepID=UPI0034CF4C90